MGKRRDRGYGWRVTALALVLLCLRGTEGQAYAQEDKEERLIRYSSSYQNEREIPEAPEEYLEEGKNRYYLADTEIEVVPMRGRTREVMGEILYPGVTKEQEIPEEAPMEIEDRESQMTVSAILPLQSVTYENESWQDDFELSAVFHEYGSDTYRLGEIELVHDGEVPPLEDCKEELLASAGLSEEEVQIQSVRWDGDSYQDENGVWCRNAVAQARRRTWDCRAIYKGKIELPEYKRYRMRMEYKRSEGETEDETKLETAENETGEAPENPSAGNIPLPFWRKWIHYGLTISVSMLLLLLAWGGFHQIRRMMDKKNS